METREEFLEFLCPSLIWGFVGTWMASQCPQVLHFPSHRGGLEHIFEFPMDLAIGLPETEIPKRTKLYVKNSVFGHLKILTGNQIVPWALNLRWDEPKTRRMRKEMAKW